jgi:hypothetical protein
MSIPPGSRTAPPAETDGLRVEHIAAQLEEAEQHRLTDYWIEKATRTNRDRTERPGSPTCPGERTEARPGLGGIARSMTGALNQRSKDHEHSPPRLALPASLHSQGRRTPRKLHDAHANHGDDGARFRRKRRASAKHSPSLPETWPIFCGKASRRGRR